MTMHVKVGGVWQEISGLHARVSGVWQEIQQGWVRVSGTWQQFFVNALVTLTGGVIFPGVSITGVRFNSDGTVDRNQDSVYSQIDVATDWVIPNGAAPGVYSIRFTHLSGDVPSGASYGTWLDLTSSRELWLNSFGLGALSGSIRAEISADGGSSVLDSGDYTLETAT